MGNMVCKKRCEAAVEGAVHGRATQHGPKLYNLLDPDDLLRLQGTSAVSKAIEALLRAASEGDIDTVRDLVDTGVDLDAGDRNDQTALMKAALAGHASVVRFLAEIGADVNASDAFGFTALLWAASSGHVDIVRFLARRGAALNCFDYLKQSALTQAASGGHADVARFLVESGDDLESVDAFKCTALINAAMGGHAEVVQYLAAVGANVDAGDVLGQTALMKAASSGQFEIVRLLVNRVTDIEAGDYCGQTALMLAASGGHVDIVRMLFRCGADVNIANRMGRTALMQASREGHVEVVRWLAAYGADLNAKDINRSTALMKALSEWRLGIVVFLAERGADLPSADEYDYGLKALMRAASEGRVEVVQYLAECATELTSTENYGLKALMLASSTGNCDVVCYLLQNGADLNARDSSGGTALMRAAKEGHIAVVRFLMENGADPNISSSSGDIALVEAISGGHLEVVRCLANHGADLKLTALPSRWTGLMEAAWEGYLEIVCFLGERGADLDATDVSGQTALMLAAKHNRVEIVAFLVNHGANVNLANKDGETAMRIAANRDHQEVLRLLTPFLQPRGIKIPVAATSSQSQLSSWFIPPFEIELLHVVNVGHVGGDYRAKWLDSNVVVKLFIPIASNSSFTDEVRLWQQLRHPNVVKLYGACDAGSLQFFVCEYASNGSLVECMKASSAEERKVWKLLYEAALGLEYLHERKIIHGNLRCSNILIGGDGQAKLANFGLSGSVQFGAPASLRPAVGSVRWQSPESVRGEAPSVASDIYSLGMCILEAVTQEVPWADEDDLWVEQYKTWGPGTQLDGWNTSRRLSGTVRDLVSRMCCYPPTERLGLVSVINELERMTVVESAEPNISLPKRQPLYAVDAYQGGKVSNAWENLQKRIHECSNPPQLRVFRQLAELFEHLKASHQRAVILERFYQTVVDFQQTTAASKEAGHILRLTATRATTMSLIGFHRQIKLMWAMLDEAGHAATTREAQWSHDRYKQIEFFVSEVSKTWLLLNELQSPEEQTSFLEFLTVELENRGSNYTPGQLEVIRSAYDDISAQIDANDTATITPDWFIPWYELCVDRWFCLGTGGFGSVYRAKWLDSDVVVKEVHFAGSDSTGSRFASLLGAQSASMVATGATVRSSKGKKERADALGMFQREVSIWFRFSHPHVVQLFGACHVGQPFFVCEYATNGTLVSYVRAYPDQLWRTLYEASLGVQYFHSRGVVHGDLKGNNIVIGSDDKAKVTDFGLSSVTTGAEEANTQISAASHWVAPECLVVDGVQPTFASDIYSLGMCIIEGMRVVESVRLNRKTEPPLPWGNLDNITVKFHVKRGKLPRRPDICTDEQWSLVERMCRTEPGKRIKISTVVDELERFASDAESTVEQCAGQSAGQDVKCITRNALKQHEDLRNVKTEMQKYLRRLESGDSDQFVALCPIYDLLWSRIEEIGIRIVSDSGIKRPGEMGSLVNSARDATIALKEARDTLVKFTETALRGFALHRRLDKLMDANFLSDAAVDPASIHNWESRCYEFLGVAGSSR